MRCDRMDLYTNISASPPESLLYRFQTTRTDPMSQEVGNTNTQNYGTSPAVYDSSNSRVRPRKQHGIRRACTGCRQQKLRCDVVKDSGLSCSRCRRLQLVCQIDATFKRVEKRKIKLREYQTARDDPPSTLDSGTNPLQSTPIENLQAAQRSFMDSNLTTVPAQTSTISNGHNPIDSSSVPTLPDTPSATGADAPSILQQDRRKQCAPASINSDHGIGRELDGVHLSSVEIRSLFDEYFDHYNQFIPFLDPSQSPEFYFQCSHLLFWSIISVASRRYTSDLTLLTAFSASVPRLLWSVLQSIPQNYHDVKALCLLCTWPFPMSSSSKDPTFMLSGTMMNLAMQIGLHRPAQAQDFSKFTVRVRPEDVEDRNATWYACRIVAQCVSTGYGQPSMNISGDISGSSIPGSSFYDLSRAMKSRAQIESFCQRISTDLYFNPEIAMTNFEPDDHLTVYLSLSQELSQLKSSLDASMITLLHLQCAELHLRLYTLFAHPNSVGYVEHLLDLYRCCEVHLSIVSPTNSNILTFSSNYVFQITLACGFAVLKLSQSPITSHLDPVTSKKTFNLAVTVIRTISVSNNDLAGRLAEVLVQLKARQNPHQNATGCESVNIKVRGRMSMSVLWDSLLEWRQGFETCKNESIECDYRDENRATRSNSTVHTAYHPEPQEVLSLEDLIFDDLFPMNWILEGGEISQEQTRGILGV